MHHPTDRDNTYHSLCYTSRGALAGARNSSMGTQEPMYVWTDGLIKQSSISLNPKQMYSRSLVWRKFQNWCCDAFVCFLGVFFVLFFCLKTLLYLMDCFNTVLKRPSMKLAGTSMPFFKWWTSIHAQNFFYTKAAIVVHSWQWDSHEYLMRSVIFLERGKLEKIKYIDTGWSKWTWALTRDQQYIYLFIFA